MKKLLIAFLFVNLSVHSQVQLTSSLKKHKGYWNDVIDYDIQNTKKYNGRSENTEFKSFDSLSRIALERFIVDRFNYFRKKKYAAKPLVWDEDLRGMCYQHVVYQRLAKKQTHFQTRLDVPNFEELADRHGLMRKNFPKFKSSSEGLINQGYQIKDNTLIGQQPVTTTYKILTDIFFTPGMGYNTCELHWNDIMNPKWDCVFIYYDFDWLSSKNEKSARSNVTIVFAEYTDEYKNKK